MNLIESSIFILDDRIIKVNKTNETQTNLATVKLNDELIKLENCFLLPGFIDSHAHIMHTGKQLNGLNLSDCKSELECIEKCKSYENRQGEWLIARGWNQELWENKNYPSKENLDKYFPNTPVFLTRIDGHAYWMNLKAYEICDINNKTKSPKGGDILLNNKNELSGIIIDNASELVYKHIPELQRDTKSKYILEAIDEFIKHGVTEIHDMDVDLDLIEIYKELEKENKLKIKIKSYIRAFDNKYIERKIKPYKSGMLEIIGLKFYMDGAIGSRGAALNEPYDDDKDNKGILLEDKTELYMKIKIGVENNWQIATHAIGDYAMNVVLDVYELIRNEFPKAHLRIEHAQMISEKDLSRIKKNNIYCSVQPLFAKSDEKMVYDRIGERVYDSYLWKTLINHGITIGASSDAPIESISVIESLKLLTNPQIEWQENEKITLSEAIEIYTLNNSILSNSNNNHQIKVKNKANITIIEGDKNDLTTWKIKGLVVNGKLHLF